MFEMRDAATDFLAATDTGPAVRFKIVLEDNNAANDAWRLSYLRTTFAITKVEIFYETNESIVRHQSHL